jgi:cell division protein FtsQ
LEKIQYHFRAGSEDYWRLKVRYKKVRRNQRKESPEVIRVKRVRRVLLFFKIVFCIVSVPAMSALFIFGHDLLTQCTYFECEHIIIEGAERLSEKQVKEQVGIEDRMNILSFNLFIAQKKLLTHPWIEQAQVRREFPNTIFIRIIEHEPLAVLDLGEKFILNTKGLIFKKLEPNDPENMPIVSGLSYSDLGTTQEPGSIRFKSVMEVLRLGGEPDSVVPNHLIQRIDVDRQIGLSLQTSDQEKMIKLGFENYSEKYGQLKKVIFQLKDQYIFNDYNCIDLINPDRIVVYPLKNELEANQKREA